MKLTLELKPELAYAVLQSIISNTKYLYGPNYDHLTKQEQLEILDQCANSTTMFVTGMNAENRTDALEKAFKLSRSIDTEKASINEQKEE